MAEQEDEQIKALASNVILKALRDFDARDVLPALDALLFFMDSDSVWFELAGLDSIGNEKVFKAICGGHSMVTGINLQELLAMQVKQLSPVELRRFRAELSARLPAVITQAAEAAKQAQEKESSKRHK